MPVRRLVPKFYRIIPPSAETLAVQAFRKTLPLL